MKKNDYTINRDDIYIGRALGIAEPDKFKCYSNDPLWYTLEPIHGYYENQSFLRDAECLVYYNGKITFTRSVLFVLDEENCANDLLYDSPHYPVFCISDKDKCLNSPICFRDVFKIGRLLEFLGYPEKMGYEHVKDFKEKYCGDWLLENCEIFGRKETTHEGGTLWHTSDSKGRHRTFNQIIGNEKLPECYFTALWQTRSRAELHTTDFVDWFQPKEIEGEIKSLEKVQKRVLTKPVIETKK